jgi:hypothetical protein
MIGREGFIWSYSTISCSGRWPSVLSLARQTSATLWTIWRGAEEHLPLGAPASSGVAASDAQRAGSTRGPAKLSRPLMASHVVPTIVPYRKWRSNHETDHTHSLETLFLGAPAPSRRGV